MPRGLCGDEPSGRRGSRPAWKNSGGHGVRWRRTLREFSVSNKTEREGESQERDGEEREGEQERGRGSLAWRLGIEIISIWRSGAMGLCELEDGARS